MTTLRSEGTDARLDRLTAEPRTTMHWIIGVRARVLVTLVAAATSLYGIGAEGFELDESTSVAFARMSWSDLWPMVTGPEINGSLYYILLRGWVLAGTTEPWVRTLSALFAIASVPVVHALAARLFGPRTAIVTALLLATNAFFVAYAQEARMYSLTLLLVSASSVLLLRAMERPTALRWTAYAAVTAASLYAHVFAGFVVMAQLAAVLLLTPGRRDIRLWMLGAMSAVAVVCLPIIAAVVSPRPNLDWIQPPTLVSVARSVLLLTGGHALLTAAFAALVLAAMIATVGAWRTNRRDRFALLFAFMWLLAAPVLALAISTFRPLYVVRYLIVILPPLAMLAAVGMGRIRSPLRRGAVIALVLGLSVVQVVGQATTATKEDWRTATTFVLDRKAAGDGIIFVAAHVAKPFAYYVDRSGASDHAPGPIYPRVTWSAPHPVIGNQPSLESALAQVGRFRRVWLVISHENNSSELLQTIVTRLDAAYSERDRWAFRDIDIRLFDTSRSAGAAAPLPPEPWPAPPAAPRMPGSG